MESSPDLESVVNAANQKSNNGTGVRPLEQVQQIGQQPVATDKQTTSVGLEAGHETNAVVGNLARALQETRNPVNGEVSVDRLSKDQVIWYELALRNAQAEDLNEPQKAAQEQTANQAADLSPRQRWSRDDDVEPSQNRDTAAPPGVGTLSYIEPGRAVSQPLYGRSIDEEAKTQISQALQTQGSRAESDTDDLMKVTLDLPFGKFSLNAFDYKPTLEAYLISRGAPIDRKGTTMDELDRTRDYAEKKLAEPLPDDDRYQVLDAQINQLLPTLDEGWNTRNHELFVSTLDQISTLTKERAATQRGLYKSIEEGLDWRKDLVTNQSQRTREYMQDSQLFLQQAEDEFGSKTAQELTDLMDEYLGVNTMMPDRREDAHILAQTIAQMKDLGGRTGDKEIENIALIYLKGFKEGRYPSEELRPVSPLILSGQSSEEEGTSASVKNLESDRKPVTLFSVGPKFREIPEISRYATLAHELQHWMDFDSLKVPGLQGVDSFAFNVSTEAAAHLYQLKIYLRLKQYFTGQSDQKIDELANLVQMIGTEGILTYGLDYLNKMRDYRLNQQAKKAA